QPHEPGQSIERGRRTRHGPRYRRCGGHLRPLPVPGREVRRVAAAGGAGRWYRGSAPRRSGGGGRGGGRGEDQERLPPPAFDASMLLPTGELDEMRAINRVAVWVTTIRHKMGKQYSREWLETELRNGLREGRLTLTIKAVEAADKGDEIADAALRT